ncbi:hypothetical protein GCM10022233_50590 [Streptomyces shaanxiensis]|uniref:Uncharacterized protein n=1 Tax=Streptomyces shaanxiensis TaxID=653357 RepID=A0ABP7VJH0_9ACTN
MGPGVPGGPERGHGSLLALGVHGVPAQHGGGEQRLQLGSVEHHGRAGRVAVAHGVRVHTPTAGGPTAALLFTHVCFPFLSDLMCMGFT